MEENDHALDGSWGHRAQSCFDFPETACQQKWRGTSRSYCFFLTFVFINILISGGWMYFVHIKGSSFLSVPSSRRASNNSSEKIDFSFECPSNDTKLTCPINSPMMLKSKGSSGESCPEYFRWIHEDLRPWKSSGITRDMVERAIPDADFRLLIAKGKVYVVRYKKAYQTRDVFTVWGILQLLRFYPGQLPDLDMVFHCGDAPLIRKDYSQELNATAMVPPPQFDYCTNDTTVTIVFPDWSFWGWPEVNLKPWDILKKRMEEGNKKTKWMEREPYAYWKGNKYTGLQRIALMECNATEEQDWNARIYHLSWREAHHSKFKDTDVANQCTHRYKIYVEGVTWSVSEKYILGCDSMAMIVEPNYDDFFMRSLQPLVHYWPISQHEECRSIKFAVDWGNKYTQKAQEIGRTGSKYIFEGLKMKNVYDYMFHLLNEYAKLLTYEPTVPPEAFELCSETLACVRSEQERSFMMESMVKSPADTGPCELPPPYDSQALQAIFERKDRIKRKIESWEERGNIEEVEF